MLMGAATLRLAAAGAAAGPLLEPALGPMVLSLGRIRVGRWGGLAVPGGSLGMKVRERVLPGVARGWE